MQENVTDKELIEYAKKARNMSYSPYSTFKVGAALLAKNGEIFLGCNIENAAYTPTNCAERTAFFKAVSEGITEFTAIAVVGAKKDDDADVTCTPCGVCRQVMMEFCDPDTFRIIIADGKDSTKSYRLKEILPFGFGPGNLE